VRESSTRAARAAPPDVAQAQRLAAIENPVIRNLEITACYAQLSAAVATRAPACSNWCTYATWASRQAGATIRGEDLARHAARHVAAEEDRRVHDVVRRHHALERRPLDHGGPVIAAHCTPGTFAWAFSTVRPMDCKCSAYWVMLISIHRRGTSCAFRGVQ
jgi:hypothetical protein